MKEMTAFCGLSCTTCKMYIATQNDDDALRAEAAKMLEDNYGLIFKPEEINCDGCLTENGRLLGFCNTCKVRACGLKKGVENCSKCGDQPCGHLMEFHNFSSKAKNAFQKLL